MKSLQEIRSTLANNKNMLFSKYGIKELAIFGSYSRNQQGVNSDVDILVDFERPIGIEFVDLAQELEFILCEKVDLVSKKGVKPAYLKYITQELAYV